MTFLNPQGSSGFSRLRFASFVSDSSLSLRRFSRVLKPLKLLPFCWYSWHGWWSLFFWSSRHYLPSSGYVHFHSKLTPFGIGSHHRTLVLAIDFCILGLFVWNYWFDDGGLYCQFVIISTFRRLSVLDWLVSTDNKANYMFFCSLYAEFRQYLSYSKLDFEIFVIWITYLALVSNRCRNIILVSGVVFRFTYKWSP